MQLQRRAFLGAALGTGAGLGLGLGHWQEALALGLPRNFDASGAPELRPFAGLAGEDLAAGDLVVEGRIPAGLRGTYYRNGPGLMARGDQRYGHWFDGDGLVQAWRFEDGRVSHRARFVRTTKFKAESEQRRFLVPAFGTAIPPQIPVRGADSMNSANTSVLRQAGRLYALWEGGSAYELDPVSLETLGPRTWSPDLVGMPFSAHPKQEPDGTTWNFGGGFNGKLAVYRIDAQGRLADSTVFDVPASAMVHDFAVSERYLVFLLPPATFDFAAIKQGASMVEAMRWHAAEATHVLVVDKSDLGKRRLFQMPAAMVFHFGNAWDAEGQIHVDYVQGEPLPQINAGMGQLMRGQRPTRQDSTPRFLRIDLKAGRLALASRSESVEFPVVDPRVVGRRHRKLWYPTAVDTGERWGFNGLMQLDIESGRRERFVFGQGSVVEEHVLVPKPGSTREGEGWLLGMGYDIARQRSFATIFDAQALGSGPVARVWLPYWVPYGFHGRFYAA